MGEVTNTGYVSRDLLEETAPGAKVKWFSNKLKDETFRATVKVASPETQTSPEIVRKWTGRGRSKKKAVCAACRRAVKEIREGYIGVK